jgi:protein TonB
MDYPLPSLHQGETRGASRRHAVIAGSVVLFHVAALWALQTGLIRRVVEVFVPVVVLSELIEPPRPKVELPAPVSQPAAPTAPRKARSLPPPPMPLAVADSVPASHTPTGVLAPPTALPPMAAPVAATAAPVAAARVELPSSAADYLQNPKPAYPAMSKRLGEQGKVVVRVLIGVDGVVQQAEIRQSSGFDRLDQAALTTAQRWRYVPGKRGGVPEAMWFNVPINFVLE